jgi:hypothetical protein
MHRVVAFTVAAAMSLNMSPLLAAGPAPGAGQAQAAAALNGTAQTAQGQSLANYTVQLRNLQTGQLAGSTTSNAAGSFSFSGLTPGNYVVEVVNPAGTIVGTSAATSVAAGATVTVGVTAAATAGAAGAAAAGAGGAAAAGAAAGGSFFASTIGVVTLAAVGAGVAGITVAANQSSASPSR